MKSERVKNVAEFININYSKHFHNTITKPTRVTSTSATLIDHIWSNNIKENVFNGIIYDTTSDHFPTVAIYHSCRGIGVSMNLLPPSLTGSTQLILLKIFKSCLQNVTWDLVFSSEDPNVSFTNFQTVFLACFNLHFPLITKECNHKYSSKPYITPDLIDMIKKKNRIQRKYAKRPITYGALYRRLRNQVTNRLKVARAKYYQDKLLENSGHCRKTWNVINEVLNRQKNTPLSDSFLVNGQEMVNPNEIAENFNKYFISVAENLVNSNNNQIPDFKCYLRERVIETFRIPPVTDIEILEVITNLKTLQLEVMGFP